MTFLHIWAYLLCIAACGGQSLQEPPRLEAEASVSASTHPKEQQVSNITALQLRYLDASTPPEYHRSYSIIVAFPSVNVTVDVYGDTIAEQRGSIAEAAWSSLKDRIADRLSTTAAPLLGETELPAGASTYSLEVQQGNTIQTTEWRKGEGAWGAVAEEMESLVPNLKALLMTPYSHSAK